MPTMLIVDDHRPTLKSLYNLFSRYGFEALTASGGGEALEVLSSNPVDCVLCDVRMPEMDGFDVLQELKDRGLGTPVVMMTGDQDVSQIVEAMRHGAFDYVLKPLDFPALRKTIERAIQHTRNTQLDPTLNSSPSTPSQIQIDTLRREFSSDLKAMELFYREVLDKLPDFVQSLDESGYFVYVNQSWRDALGYTDDDLKALSIIEIIHPESRDNYLHVFGEIMRGAQIVHMETTFLAKNGRSVHVVGDIIQTVRPGPFQLLGMFRDVTLQRRTEKALRSKDAILSRAQQIARLGTVSAELSSGMLQLDSGAVAVFGSDQSLTTVADFVDEKGHPDDREAIRSCLLDPIRNLPLLARGIGIDQKVVWVEFHPPFSASRATAKSDHHVVPVQDVTSWMEAQQELRKLSRAVEHAGTAVVITDTDGTIEYVNPAFTTITGYSRAEAMGQNPKILTTSGTPPQTHRELWDTVTRGRVWRGEFVNRKKDGSYYSESAVIAPVRDTAGVISHFVATKQDISEQKRLQEELESARDHLSETVKERTVALRHSNALLKSEVKERRQAEERARSAYQEVEQILQTSAGAMRVVDTDYRVVRSNEALSQMIGVSREEMKGSKCFETFPGKACDRSTCTLRRVLAGEQVTDLEVTKRTKEGQAIPCLLNARELRNADGQVIGMIEEFRDLTQTKRMQSLARVSEEANLLGRILADVRHELGNPVNTIKTALAVMAKKLADLPIEKHRMLIERMSRDVSRMEVLLKGLRSFNQFESVSLEPVDLVQMARNLVAEQREDWREIGFVFSTDREEIEVRADRDALGRVMRTLVANAIDLLAGCEEPRVSIKIQSTATLAIVVIRDNGSGLSARQLTDLFRPFGNDWPTDDRLAMILVRKALARMDGTLDVSSDIGVGTRVEITLPVLHLRD